MTWTSWDFRVLDLDKFMAYVCDFIVLRLRINVFIGTSSLKIILFVLFMSFIIIIDSSIRLPLFTLLSCVARLEQHGYQVIPRITGVLLVFIIS